MSTNNKTRITLVAAALVGGLSIAGVAAAQPAPHKAPATATTTTSNTPVVEHEAGIVLEGSGSVGDLSASITVYENSLYGNSVQVVLGDDVIGDDEGTTAYLVDGVLQATVRVDGKAATLSGRLAPTGRPEKIVEPAQDAGEQLVTRGTHTELVGDVTLSYDGVVIPLELAPAFAYDLEVRTVALYGN